MTRLKFSQLKPAPTEFLFDLQEIVVELTDDLSEEERYDLEARAAADPDGWYTSAIAADWLRAASGDPKRIALQGLSQREAQAELEAISQLHGERTRYLPPDVARFPLRWNPAAYHDRREQEQGAVDDELDHQTTTLSLPSRLAAAARFIEGSLASRLLSDWRLGSRAVQRARALMRRVTSERKKPNA